MSRARKFSVTFCVLFVAFAARPALAAETSPPGEPWSELPAEPAPPEAEEAALPETVSLRLVSDEPGVTLRVYTLHHELVKSCSDACTVSLAPGRYLIGTRLWGDDETLRRVRVDESKELRVTPGDKSLSKVGLGLGIAGGALLIGGFTAVFLNAGSDSHPGNQDVRLAGAIAMLAGIPCSAVGWPLFVGYRRPSFDEMPASAALEMPRRENNAAQIADNRSPTWGVSYAWSF